MSEETNRRQAWRELKNDRGYHTEQIECPACKQRQGAMVQHTQPFYTYVHTCARCLHVITESEWNPCSPASSLDQNDQSESAEDASN